jgi:sugar phosphate isomerase/epimerase
VDEVFCTTAELNQPYVVTLVGLEYSPEDWFADPHVIVTDDPGKWASFPKAQPIQRPIEWDVHLKYGKMNFVFGDWADVVKRLREGEPKRVVLVARPGELGRDKPDHEILGPDGRPVFWIYQTVIGKESRT